MSILKALSYITDRLDSWKAAAAKWTPGQHPRYPKGHPKAGKFMSKRDIDEAKSGKAGGKKETAPGKEGRKVEKVNVKTKWGTFEAHKTKLDNGTDVVAFQAPNKKWYVVDLKARKALDLNGQEPKSVQEALKAANSKEPKQDKTAEKHKPKEKKQDEWTPEQTKRLGELQSKLDRLNERMDKTTDDADFDKLMTEQDDLLGKMQDLKAEVKGTEKIKRFSASPIPKKINTASAAYRKTKEGIEIDPPEQFASKDEAKTWLEANVADKVNLGRDKDKALEAASWLRRLSQVSPLGDKMTGFSLEKGDIPVAPMAFGAYSNKDDTIFISGSAGMKATHKTPQVVSHFANDRARKQLTSSLSRLEKGVEKHESSIAALEASISKLSGKEKAREQKKLTTKIAKLEQVKNQIGSYKQQIDDTRRLKMDQVGTTGDMFSGIAATVIHEYGHAWHQRNAQELDDKFNLSLNLFSKITDKNKKYCTTSYSRVDPGEAFAEAFSLYHLGQTQALQKDLVEYFDTKFPSLAFGKRWRAE